MSNVARVLNLAPTILAGDYESGLFERLMAYEHPELILRLEQKLEISAEKALSLFEDTKRFLYLCGAFPDGRWGPSQSIDRGWHEFIVYTRDYIKFCEDFFGRYIHHCPNSPNGQKDIMRSRRTITQALEIFGNLSENWRYENEDGVYVLGPGISDNIDAIGPCDSCGCSPCS